MQSFKFYLSYSYLPNRLEVFLLDTQKLTELTGDDGRMTWGIVQDGLTECRANSKRAYRHSLLERDQVNP